MKTYIGTKIIKAKQMSLLEAKAHLNRDFGFNGELDINGDADGYLVEYQELTKGAENLYRAWSPKDVFESAYCQIDGMTFGFAIEALKNDKKVARAGWNGKGMWLKLVEMDHYSLESCVGVDMGCGQEGWNLLPWVGMKTADGKFVPWLASQTDVLAEDWQIVD